MTKRLCELCKIEEGYKEMNAKSIKRREFLKKSGAALLSAGAFEGLSTIPHKVFGANEKNIIETSFGNGTKRIYIAVDDHTDYMWTADEKAYKQAFLEMLDYYIDLADRTIKTEPSQYQSRFSCDGNIWMWIYEKNRTEEQFQKLIDCIKSGHINVPLTVLILCYGAMPAEAVIRSMYYSGSIERRYNLRFPMAAPMEDQTMPYGVASLWAGAGAKYCWMGICNCATRVLFRKKRFYDIYWWTGLDKSRMLIKWNTYNKSKYGRSLGGYAEARYPSEAISYVDKDRDFKTNYPYNIIGIFGKGHDDLMTKTDEFIDVAKKETTKNRQVIVSNIIDFFRDFEATYGETLPSFSASFGNEWELYTASMAELTARVKRSVEKLRCAEALATLVSLQEPNFMTKRKDDCEKAFIDMGLYWNHAWTADGSNISDDSYRDWVRKIAGNAENYVNTLYDDALKSLGSMIRKDGKFTRFYAFNPISWKRTDVAEFIYNGKTPIHVIDISTGLETPSQIVQINGECRLRLLVEDVPPMGYKVFEIRPGEGNSFKESAAVNGDLIENEFYRIKVSEYGAITSLIDKKHNNRELVRLIGNRAVNDLGSGPGMIEVENSGPVFTTIKATSQSPLKHTTRITLFRHSKRIDISNEIKQNFSSIGDNAPTWSFSFDLMYPDVWHEEIGAIIRAKLLTEGGHYSPTHARYDWLTLNHFADISDRNGFGVTLSNEDCCFMKIGNSNVYNLDVRTPQINVLVGGQIDGPKMGIPSQGGDSYFLQRFALKTHEKFSKAESMRFALEHQNPIVCGKITGGSQYPGTQFSLVNISDSNVLLWALKPHQDGISNNGIVMRLWNMGENNSDFTVSIPNGKVISAKELTHIETPVKNLQVKEGCLTASTTSFQMKSYGIVLCKN